MKNRSCYLVGAQQNLSASSTMRVCVCVYTSSQSLLISSLILPGVPTKTSGRSTNSCRLYSLISRPPMPRTIDFEPHSTPGALLKRKAM